MAKLIVITGITGQQGSSIAHTYLELPDWKVRGITRDVSSSKAKSWAAKGAEVVQGDFDDVDSLSKAFQGAHAIFANTDFFSHVFSSGDQTSQALLYAFDREVEQGLNIAKAASSLTVLSTLEHFVYSSLSDASTLSKGKYTTIYHFDAKAKTISLIKSRFPEVGKRMSYLQMGHYVSNWKAVPAMAPQRRSSDRVFVTRRPFSGNTPIPFAVPDKDTGVFVKALLSHPPGKTLSGVSETMTFQKWMEVFGQVLNVQAAFEEVSPENFFKDFPQPLGQDLRDTNEYMKEFGYHGGDPNVLFPKELDPNIRTTSMEEYIKLEDWSSLLKS